MGLSINVERKRLIVIAAAPILVISCIFTFQLFVYWWGREIGYLLGFSFYWLIWCALFSLRLLSLDQLKMLYRPILGKSQIINLLLILLPVIATGSVVFRVYAGKAGLTVLCLALLFSLINGVLEELFWRGLYNTLFRNSFWFGFVYPTIFFGCWHVAPYLIKSVSFEGGALSFVGGAFFMGTLWGWAVWKSKSIFFTTYAHVCTNFFAFTGFIYVNF